MTLLIFSNLYQNSSTKYLGRLFLCFTQMRSNQAIHPAHQIRPLCLPVASKDENYDETNARAAMDSSHNPFCKLSQPIDCSYQFSVPQPCPSTRWVQPCAAVLIGQIG